MATGVTTATVPSATLVASQVPPSPTSTTATSTGASANAANAMAVSTSKNDSGTPWRLSTSSTYGSTSWYAAMKRSASSGSPSTQIRSRMELRCGLVNLPVRSPRSRSSASIMRAVDVLPLVPVMWMTGQERCGSPSSAVTAAIRSSVGSMDASGRLTRISRSISCSKVCGSPVTLAAYWPPDRAQGQEIRNSERERDGGHGKLRGGLRGRGTLCGVIGYLTADPVAPGVLGAVDRRVSGGDQIIQVACRGDGRDAYRDRDHGAKAVTAAIADGDRLVGDAGTEPFRDPAGLDTPGAGKQDREFLAAEPADQVIGTQLRLEPVRYGAQHEIPREMTVSVVDSLKVVDINHGDGRAGAAARGTGQLGDGFALPRCRVEQACLAVDPRLGDQLGMHQEAPLEHNRWQHADHQDRVDRDDEDGYDAEAELDEIRQGSVPGEQHVPDPRHRIGQPDGRRDETGVDDPADELAGSDGGGPGECVSPAAGIRANGRANVKDH